MARTYNPSTDYSEELKNKKGMTPKEYVKKKMKQQKELDWKKAAEEADRKRYEESIKERYKKAQTKDKKPARIDWEELRKKVYARRIAKGKAATGMFFKSLPRLAPIKKGSLARIKLNRIKNQIEAVRLQNKLEKMKIIRRLEKTGGIPFQLPQFIPPAPVPFFNPITNADIESGFNADIGNADGNIFGPESYFGGEDYFGEDYLGQESFFEGLEVNNLGKRVASPLLY